jgi:hypothetical protein
MLIQRANKSCAEPTPYQAQAMGQWVGEAMSIAIPTVRPVDRVGTGMPG